MSVNVEDIVLHNFREYVKSAKHILVITGAGLSAASGIPTFRDGGGMWNSLDVEKLATPEAFATNPGLVWQFYHYRRVKALEAQPNQAHYVLARLSIPKLLKKVAPQAKTFHHVTQNVDRLIIRAMDNLNNDTPESLSHLNHSRVNSVIEIHGRITDVQCTQCGHREEVLSSPLCSSLDTSILNGYEDAGSEHRYIAPEDLPRCSACGALARPGVVWFGEKPYHLDDINLLVYKADLCIVIGTSSTVRPASTYAYRVQRHGGKVAVFNLNESVGDERADFIFRGPCETELLRVFPELA